MLELLLEFPVPAASIFFERDSLERMLDRPCEKIVNGGIY